jgi:PAS domain S-box-containing protein
VTEKEGTVEQRLRAAVESAPSGLLMVDGDGRIVLVNREIERLFGYTRDELLGESVDILLPDRSRSGHADFRAGFVAQPRARLMGAGRDLYGLRKDGTEVPLEIGLSPIETDEGMFVLSSVVDISARRAAERERHQLEGQLRQAQKMEAVGTLAGGIAHDFNNILGAIIGYGELLEYALTTDRARVDLADLLTQAERGRHLVERLLAFSRRQEAERRPLSMSRALEDIRRLLRATLPANIDIRVALHEPLPRVLADRTAIQQILMNLGTNAAHAMPGGGVIDIWAEAFYVRDSKARAHPELREGPHILVAVSDTGAGMSAEVKARALEPFFTTKPPGSGSGLGLSMVHGIMKEHQGGLELDSEPEAGTTVRCYFPVLDETNGESNPGQGPVPDGRGQRILFIDDEPSLALVGRRRLEQLGYRVTAVTDGAEALALFRRDPAGFDVVMTDYSLPGRNGVELVRAMREARPDLRAVLLTGYVDAVPPHEARVVGIEHIVQKPLTLAELGAVVAAALDAG